jgi:hypothetical protein
MQPLRSRLHNERPLNNSRNRRAIIHGPAVTSEAGLPTYRELDDVLRLMAIAGQPLIDGSNSSGPDQHSKPCVRAERENHSSAAQPIDWVNAALMLDRQLRFPQVFE